MKVGQWFRFDDTISKITNITKEGDITWLHTDNQVFKAIGYEKYKSDIIIKDTPQGLIEVGDLVEFSDGDKMFVTRLDNMTVVHTFNKMSFVRVTNKVIKILTPNGKNYICQWEEKR